MEAYNPSIVPRPYGLANTGAICYLNSFLQSLASCTSLMAAVINNPEYMSKTATGRSILKYFTSIANGTIDHYASSDILKSLMEDLGTRRPGIHFGDGQESASELFVLMLDMISYSAKSINPVNNLFLHRFRCDLCCNSCGNVSSTTTDYSVCFNLFHIDSIQPPVNTPEDFSKSIYRSESVTEDYLCSCGKKTGATRSYSLTMVPEIVVCVFNIYHSRPTRYFPDFIRFPAIGGGHLHYILISQIEHSGTLSGGHYWARCLRSGNQVYLLNDSGIQQSTFANTPETYMVFYHYQGLFT